MAEVWTNPKTWAQEIVTVGDLNTQLRDNLRYLRNRPLVTDTASGLSSTAGTETNIRNLAFEVEHGRPVLLLVSSTVNTTSGSHAGTFSIRLDGTLVYRVGYASTNLLPYNWSAIVPGLAVGSHALTLTGYVSAGTLYWNYIRLAALELA